MRYKRPRTLGPRTLFEGVSTVDRYICWLLNLWRGGISRQVLEKPRFVHCLHGLSLPIRV